jgi:DNA-binding transcriptional LysR family regulator
MHIENFKVFCDLVESKSFSRSAKLNSITQSAVSQQLRSIEEQLKVIIVDRSQKQFRLTAEGEIFYRAAKDILSRFDQLTSDIQASRNIVSGHLRISTIYSIGLHELHPYIKKFLREYPAVNLQVEYRISSFVYEDVLQGVADIGLVAFPQKSRLMEVINFTEDRLAVICAPNHPLANQKAVQLKDLVEHKLIGFIPDNPTRKAIDHYLHEAKINWEPALEFDNIETMKRAVEIDSGIALVPAATVTQEVQYGTLVALEIKGKPLIRPLGILHKKGRILTPPMRKFIETLVGKD